MDASFLRCASERHAVARSSLPVRDKYDADGTKEGGRGEVGVRRNRGRERGGGKAP